MNSINPFDLLNVNSKSSIKDLKKNYYQLSLYCHPDKGGSKDDMIIIQNAYEYVKLQLENSTEQTYEQLEQEFQEFCKIQEKEPPKFCKIFSETHDEWSNVFNTSYSEQKYSNLFDKGYGNLMVLEEGTYKGGYTGFPQYGVAFDVRTGDFLAMDVHEWHCNTKLSGKDYSRVSVVAYLREKMIKCKGLQLG